MRQVVLDTETTGLDPQQGHRIIEIGCVELDNRRLTGRHFQRYINPQREVDAGAVEVHGLTGEFLSDKPLFHQIVDEFLAFIDGAELIIHNAPFDLGFLDKELSQLDGYADMASMCSTVDSLVLARAKHPGQRNNLDALCKRYGVDNTQRELHGALLDAEILADVYLLMTSGQSSLSLKAEESEGERRNRAIKHLDPDRQPLMVLKANDEELSAHEKRLRQIDRDSSDGCFWLSLNKPSSVKT